MAITKVKSVQGSGTFESQHGLLYKFEYAFEDGTSLVANHKSEACPFKAGDTIEYEIKGENSYGKWGKVGKPKDPHQPSENGHEKKTFGRSRQSELAMIYCNALTQANAMRGTLGFRDEGKVSQIESLCNDADYIAQFIIKKSGI